MSSDAIQKALAARDAVAEPTNRLKRIVSSMKISILDALEKAETDAKTKVASVENTASDAAKTYGATSSDVIASQQDVADAKAQLNNVSEHIKNVEIASELSTLVQESGAAFQALEVTEAEVISANNHANSAKMGLVTTVGTIVAVGAAAVGGGFLYWRRRKNIKHKKHENVGKLKSEGKKEEPKHDEQKDKFCNKCGSKIEKHHKFCPKCGMKVK